MTTRARVRRYVNYGFTAERVAELLGFPLDEVRTIKTTMVGQQVPFEGSEDDARKKAVELVLGGKSLRTACLRTGLRYSIVASDVLVAKAKISEIAASL